MFRINIDLSDMIGIAALILIGLFWGGVVLYAKLKDKIDEKKRKRNSDANC